MVRIVKPASPPGLTRRTVTPGLAATLDRKSTRLKSSHAHISYAGFFFKRERRPQKSTLFPHQPPSLPPPKKILPRCPPGPGGGHRTGTPPVWLRNRGPQPRPCVRNRKPPPPRGPHPPHSHRRPGRNP